jgi:MFS transporter, FHS family, L-fucose permease
MWVVKLPSVNEETDNAQDGNNTRNNVWQFPHLILGVLALFCAEGTESITSFYIIPYGQQHGFSTAASQFFVDYIIYAMIAGYLVGTILIPKYITQARALATCSVLGCCFAIGAMTTSGFTSVLFFIAMGFSNALNWPCIWPLALQGVGRFTKTAAALLIMAIAGDAIFPVIYAQLNEWFNWRAGLYLLLGLYVMIFLYATAGHKKKSW